MFMMMGIYIDSKLEPFAKFTNKSKSTEFKDIFPRRMSLKIMETVSMSMKNSYKLCDRKGHPLLLLKEIQ